MFKAKPWPFVAKIEICDFFFISCYKWNTWLIHSLLQKLYFWRKVEHSCIVGIRFPRGSIADVSMQQTNKVNTENQIWTILSAKNARSTWHVDVFWDCSSGKVINNASNMFLKSASVHSGHRARWFVCTLWVCSKVSVYFSFKLQRHCFNNKNDIKCHE